MNETGLPETSNLNNDREAMQASLFASLVLQQTNMALLVMGKIPHPESGEAHVDLEAAKMFIDQLEMLETKTRGNLSKEESQLLAQSLTNLRLAFVESAQPPTAKASPTPAPSADAGNAPDQQPTPSPAPEPDSPKKFSKKY